MYGSTENYAFIFKNTTKGTGHQSLLYTVIYEKLSKAYFSYVETYKYIYT